MVGGGILRAPGAVVGHVGLPAVALALWMAAGLHGLLSANIIAEVMTVVPRSGGLFVPVRAAFGRPAGLLIGWTDWLNNVASTAAMAIVAGEFMALIFPTLSGHQGLVGSAITAALVLLNWLGVREGSAAQIIGSALKLAFLVAIALAIFLVPVGSPATASSVSLAEPLGLWGVVVAYQLIFGVDSGWPNSAYFSEEDTNPGRNIPRSLFTSIVAVTMLYMLVNAALLWSLDADQLRSSELPLALAASAVFGAWSIKAIAAVALVSVLSWQNAGIMVAPRVLYGLAEDGLFPSVATRVNKGGTPAVALGITALFALPLALTGEFETVFLIMGALGLLPLVLAEASLFKLRRSQPDLPRPYLARGYPWLPGFVLLLDAALLAMFILADLRSGLGIIVAVAICIPLAWVMRFSNARAARAGTV
jgi:APA family basic amino acid/polyamine antiporter